MRWTFARHEMAIVLSALCQKLVRSRFRQASFLAAVTLCSAFYLGAQTFGNIEGQVKDVSGAVVANASITVTNTETNVVRTSQTNSDGAYSFPALVPGTYNVQASLQGFKSESQQNLVLQVTSTVRADFTLQPGQISEKIEVNASAEQLNTDNATVGTTIEQQRIVDMPLNGRDYLQLVTLSNNVTTGFSSAQQASGRQGGTRANDNDIAVGGQRASFNHYTLDGIENTDVNFNLYIFQPSIDAIQEFRVQTGVYPAEFGREASQVNVNTRPGTNLYHGSLFEFFRNYKMDALPYAFTSKPTTVSPFKWNQYGFELGGPLSIPKLFNAKDKLFFMVNYEGFNQRQQTNALYNVATLAMRKGDFSELLPQGIQLYYPNGRSLVPGANGALTVAGVQPIPGNVIPTSQLSPTSLQMLQYEPLPNQPGGGFTNNFLNTVGTPTDKNEFTTRVDWAESSKSTWFGRYSWTDESSSVPTLAGAGAGIGTHAYQALISNTRIFSPTIVNEARFGVNKFYNALTPLLACKQNVVGSLGLPGLNTGNCDVWGIPQMRNIGAISGFGDDTNGPYILQDGIGQLIDNVSLIRGKHSLRFGGEVRRDRFNQLGNEFPRGAFNWGASSTASPSVAGSGFGFAGFMLGSPTEVDAAYGLAFLQMRATSQAYYIDDTWRVSPKLTLTLGLRYELTPPLVDVSKTGGEANIQLPYFSTNASPAIQNDLALHPTDVRIGTNGNYYQNLPFFFPNVKVARDGRLGSKMYNTDYLDFAPRLGIAWSPTPTWVIRAGAGFFYSQDSNNSKFDLARTLGGRQNNVNNNVDSRIPSMTWTNYVTPGSTIIINNPTLYGILQDIRTPVTYTYLLNAQRQLPGSTLLEFGYLGSLGRHLWSLYDGNEKTPGLTSVPSRSPFPEIGIIQAVQGGDNSNYNSGSVKITKRLSQGLTIISSYTYAKSLDDASAIRGQGDTIFPQNSRCLECDYGRSAFDIRHRWVSSVLYDLPFGSGRTFLNHGRIVNEVVGGWQIGSIYTLQSGLPGYPTPGPDQSNTGNGNGRDRLNATGQNINLSNPTTNEWFNVSAFSLEPFGTFGNAGRNTIPYPKRNDWDFSLIKQFRVVERSSLLLRLDAFNFLNHPNWGNPGNNWGQAVKPQGTFGQVTSTAVAMRQLQVSLKLNF